jgi:hypothetical protein
MFFIFFFLETEIRIHGPHVYGPVQDDQKTLFLTELVNMCSNENLSVLIGGDFNILRSHEEKNNDNYNDR